MSEWKVTGGYHDSASRVVFTVTKGTRRLDHREQDELEALLAGWWEHDGEHHECVHHRWSTNRYIARPENNTELEEVSMTKVTVEHKRKPRPSIFEPGNLVVTGTDEIVLVTDKLNGCTFRGVQLAPHNGDTTKYFDKKSCEQFHGTLTLESP